MFYMPDMLKLINNKLPSINDIYNHFLNFHSSSTNTLFAKSLGVANCKKILKSLQQVDQADANEDRPLIIL